MSRLPKSCRNVMPILLASLLLSGCEAYIEARRELGLDPQDPPRAEVPPPPPGTISQANWAAQRSAVLARSDQGNTAPVGYKEPEKPADPAAAAASPSAPVAAAPATAARSQPAAPGRGMAQPPAPASSPASAPAARPAPALPATTATNPATAAMSPGIVATGAALPAGYRPSASIIDQPAMAQEQQQTAAAAGAQPTPPDVPMSGGMPMLSGSMKGGAAAIGGWKAHLASHRTESAAINEWQELLRGNATLYAQFDPLVEWTDTPRGPFARLLLVGFAERKDADAACAKLRSSTRYCAAVKD